MYLYKRKNYFLHTKVTTFLNHSYIRYKILTVHRTIEDEQDGDEAGPSSSANDQPQNKKRRVAANSNTSALRDTTGTVFKKKKKTNNKRYFTVTGSEKQCNAGKKEEIRGLKLDPYRGQKLA